MSMKPSSTSSCSCSRTGSFDNLLGWAFAAILAERGYSGDDDKTGERSFSIPGASSSLNR